PATILEIARRYPRPENLFAVVEDQGSEVVAAALRLPPRRMLTSAMDDAAARALMQAWLEADPDVPGISSPSSVARAAAEVWEGSTGGRSKIVMAEGLHTLERVVGPARPARGALRPATAADRDLLIGWIDEFQREAGLDGNPADM